MKMFKRLFLTYLLFYHLENLIIKILEKKMKLIPSSKINDSPIKSLIKDTLYNSFAQAIFKILETQYLSLKGFIFFYITIYFRVEN